LQNKCEEKKVKEMLNKYQGTLENFTQEEIEKAFGVIKTNTEIDEILISGVEIKYLVHALEIFNVYRECIQPKCKLTKNRLRFLKKDVLERYSKKYQKDDFIQMILNVHSDCGWLKIVKQWRSLLIFFRDTKRDGTTGKFEQYLDLDIGEDEKLMKDYFSPARIHKIYDLWYMEDWDSYAKKNNLNKHCEEEIQKFEKTYFNGDFPLNHYKDSDKVIAKNFTYN
jgi:hypothetical protein